MPILQYLFDPSRPSQKVALSAFPFVIGRDSNVQFTVPSPVVSKRHVELFERDNHIWIRDLSSRNGTFVNGKQIREVMLENGDIIHIAHTEFRFFDSLAPEQTPDSLPMPETDPITATIPPSVLYGRPLLEEMIQSQAVRVVFQPVVELATNKVLGFEALGRGCFPQLSTRPIELFRLAGMCRMAVRLSRAFRQSAIRQARDLPQGSLLFCNIHPEELIDFEPSRFDELFPDLSSMPKGVRLVLEIHEEAFADIALLRELRKEVRLRGIRLAYDDFGSGQSRLTEMAEVPPDFIKLDMNLVRGIDIAEGRRDTVQSVCDLSGKLGVQVIAEGIENRRELDTCVAAGCRLGQGFLLGHPELADPAATVLPPKTSAELKI